MRNRSELAPHHLPSRKEKDVFEVGTINLDKRKVQADVLGQAIANTRRYRKEQTILCLPGEHCWDIHYLKSLKGVKKIVGLEESDVLFNKIKDKFKGHDGIEILNKKTSEFLYNTDLQFDLIYLDYFSNFNSVVRLDTEIIFARKLLKEKGKLIINFYGAREGIADQYKNKMVYEAICSKFSISPKNENEAVERCRWFNAHIMLMKPQYRVKTSVPVWNRYKSESAYMYTAYFTVNGYLAPGGKKTTGAEKLNLSQWFLMDGQKQIKTISGTSKRSLMFTLSRIGMTNVKEEFYKNKILKFYNENLYTPSAVEMLGRKGSVANWLKLVRSAGLCPRNYSTEQDLVGELKRIHQRDGTVTTSALKKAKIFRKLGWAKQFARLCSRNGLNFQYEISEKQKEVRRLEKIITIDRYLEYLENKGSKTKFDQYSFIRKNKITNYKDASGLLRKLKNEAEITQNHLPNRNE